MNSSMFLFIAIFIMLISAGNSKAQKSANEPWNKIISMHFGYPMGSNDWEYTHPLYNGLGGVQTIREPGIYEGKYTLYGGIEFSKGYLGVNANAGIFPGEIKVDKTAEKYKFNSIFVGIAGVFFPLGKPIDNLVPFLKIGCGGIKASGDLDNTALFISFSGGIRSFLFDSFWVSFAIKGMYTTYDEIPLTETVTGDISVTPFIMEVGLYYML